MAIQTIAGRHFDQKRLDAIGSEVGNTPLLRINSLSSNGVSVYAKSEWQQLGGSVKARAAYAIIRDGLLSGKWRPGMRLLDASSGNTAIAYAFIASRLGLPVTICMPSNATQERKETLESLGVELVFTPPIDGTEGAQQVARDLQGRHPDMYFYADQYGNDNNWKAHFNSTAPEIYNQTRGHITHFIAGLGTTGTFCGTTSRLKQLKPGVTAVALQPDYPLHGLEGWKHLDSAGVPRIFNPRLHDEMREVSSEQAYAMIRFMAENEGLHLSPSSAANLVGAAVLANELHKGVIVTVLPDSIDRYGEVKHEIFGQ